MDRRFLNANQGFAIRFCEHPTLCIIGLTGTRKCFAELIVNGFKRMTGVRVTRFVEDIIIQPENVESIAENKDDSDGVETHGASKNLSCQFM